MNWEAIKQIYRQVLIYNNKIEYLGGDKYRMTSYYSSGEKHWETEYKNRQLHGKSIRWLKNGNKWCEREYQNGQAHGKNIGWNTDGSICYKTEY